MELCAAVREDTVGPGGAAGPTGVRYVLQDESFCLFAMITTVTMLEYGSCW